MSRRAMESVDHARPSRRSRGLGSVLVATAVTAFLLNAAPTSEENANPQILSPAIEDTVPELESVDTAAPEFPQDLTFSYDPEIIPLANPLPTPVLQPGERFEAKGVTIHWWGFEADGDIEVLRRLLRDNTSCGDTGCSSQYAVTENGNKYRMMKSPLERAMHATGGNDTTFGIEIEGTPEQFALSGPNFNPAKFVATVELVAELVDDFELPLDGPTTCRDVVGVHGHHEYNHCIPPENREALEKHDPGDEYLRAVKAAVRWMQQEETAGR